MLPDDAARMLDDEHWLVRAAAVQQAPLEALTRLVTSDPEDAVRQLAAERLTADGAP